MQPVIKARVRAWGNSMGIIIPSDIVEREHIKPNMEIELMLLHDSCKVLQEMYGAMRGSKVTAQQFKDELRRHE